MEKSTIFLIIVALAIVGCGDGNNTVDATARTCDYQVNYSNPYVGLQSVMNFGFGPNLYPLDTTSEGELIITDDCSRSTIEIGLASIDNAEMLEIDRFPEGFTLAVSNCVVTPDNIVARDPGDELIFENDLQRIVLKYVAEIRRNANGMPICFGDFPAQATGSTDCSVHLVLETDLDNTAFWVTQAEFVGEEVLPASFPVEESIIYPGRYESTVTGFLRNQIGCFDVELDSGTGSNLSDDTDNWDLFNLISLNATSMGSDAVEGADDEDLCETGIPVELDGDCNISFPAASTEEPPDPPVINSVNWILVTLCGGDGFATPPEAYFDLDPNFLAMQPSSGCWTIVYNDVPTDRTYGVLLQDTCPGMSPPVTDPALQCGSDQWLTPIGSTDPTLNPLSSLIPPYIVEVTTSACSIPYQPVRTVGGGLEVTIDPITGCLDVDLCEMRFVFDQNDPTLVLDWVRASIGVNRNVDFALFDQGTGSWARNYSIAPGRYRASVTGHEPSVGFFHAPTEDYGSCILTDPLGNNADVLVDSQTVYMAPNGDDMGTGYTPVKAIWNLEVLFDTQTGQCSFLGSGLGEGSDGNIIIIIDPNNP